MPLLVIVDDRISNRSIFSKLAGSVEEDVSVSAFADPEQALDWLADHTPDLVITDFKMPKMNGAAFIRRFRELPGCADVPVVAVTVYEERALRLEALEAGATDFLLSPVDHHEFQTRVRNLLKLRKQQEIIKSRAFSLERELQDSERSHQAALRDSRERLAQVIDIMPALISATDREGRCVFANASLAALYRLDPATVVGKAMSEVVGAKRDQRHRTLDRIVFRSGNPLPSFEETILDRTGASRVFLTTKTPLRNAEDEVVAVVTTSLDISERKLVENHLVRLAHHDDLTGLPNRVLLQERLRCETARLGRGDRLFALHILDLDRFKSVNDAHGHRVGDELLKAVAARLAAAVRDSDTVARLGGDEFAILQTGLCRREEALAFAAEINRAVAEPFLYEGQELVATASIGIAVQPSSGGDGDELLKNADVAMYRAKAEGRNTARLFAPAMMKTVHQEVALEAALRQGLANGEFLLHYQPQIDLRSGRIVGAEALVRWDRPERGLVPPGEFLPLAEETGLIVPLGEWVLRQACREAKGWTRAGLPPLKVAVNLSAVQFQRQNVRHLVTEVLRETGLDPARLELELTETIVLQNAQTVANDLKELQRLGVSFAIDDFGTGYSSLAYVKSFPVNRLKIAQCFVRSLAADSSDAAIVRAIINLGHSLGTEVIAEGAETAEQVAHLRAEGCNQVQGFFFSKPLPAEAFVALVREEGSPRLPSRSLARSGSGRTT